MKLVQIRTDRGPRAGFEDGGRYVHLKTDFEGIASTLDLVKRFDCNFADLSNFWERAERSGVLNVVSASPGHQPDLPIHPPEVWACGVTYAPSRDFREGESLTGFYAQVYADTRPELFFKATASRCVASGAAIGIRRDSVFTAIEPELAVVLTAEGRVFGYTIANDVSAWDIERANPLYLPQSKIYSCCCAIGPSIVTADRIAQPTELRIDCHILRNGKRVFAGSVPVQQMKRTLQELIDYLRFDNPVPDGTVLLTGTGIIQPPGLALEEGDEITITVEPIGSLINVAKRLPGLA